MPRIIVLLTGLIVLTGIYSCESSNNPDIQTSNTSTKSESSSQTSIHDNTQATSAISVLSSSGKQIQEKSDAKKAHQRTKFSRRNLVSSPSTNTDSVYFKEGRIRLTNRIVNRDSSPKNNRK